MRLFIAVPLPSELAERAAALLPASLPALKRVRPELMHITLAFLGWTQDERLPAVVEAAGAAAAGRPAFDLSLAVAGRFPAAGRPRVVWLGVADGRPALEAIAAQVAEQLRARDLRFDDRPFAPHLTLARVAPDASAAEARTVSAAVGHLAAPELRARVDRIAVVQSVLSRKGPRYTELAAAPLATGD
jgi:2'-5' RNA ligase